MRSWCSLRPRSPSTLFGCRLTALQDDIYWGRSDPFKFNGSRVRGIPVWFATGFGRSSSGMMNSQNGTILRRPFFFFGLLDDPEAEVAADELELLASLEAGADLSISFT